MIYSYSGWWFQTFLFSIIYGIIHQPFTHIFQRGRSTTNQNVSMENENLSVYKWDKPFISGINWDIYIYISQWIMIIYPFSKCLVNGFIWVYHLLTTKPSESRPRKSKLSKFMDHLCRIVRTHGAFSLGFEWRLFQKPPRKLFVMSVDAGE